MFAVVRTGGKQYRVHPGDKIVVEKLAGDAGDKVTLGDVLLAGDGGSLKSTDGLTVAAEIVAQAKGEKVTVFKKRRRHNYRRKKGHRQQHTILKIVAIGDHKEARKAAPTAEAEAPAKAASGTEGSAKAAAATAKPKKERVPEAAPADVEAQPTENPAPQDESKANPPREGDVEQAPEKSAGGKKSAGGGKAGKSASTENAAPAKSAAKKSSKAK
jgi:large subunit ribosomal protein L21